MGIKIKSFRIKIMSLPKLSYFNIEGLAESVRLTFKVAGLPFEDNRFSFEEWAELKLKMPNRQVPVLEMNGKTLTQSGAMIRYLGVQNGMYPTDPEGIYACEQVMGLVDDLKKTYMSTVYMGMKPEMFGMENMSKEDIGVLVKRLREECTKESMPLVIKNIQENVMESGIMKTGKVSVSDIYVFTAMRQLKKGHLDHIPVTVFDEFKGISEFYDKMMEVDAIKNHYN